MSAALFVVSVAPDGAEPFEMEAGPRDVLFWEKVSRRTIGEIESNPTMAALYSLAHATAKRQGRYAGSLEEFEATCDAMVRPLDDAVDPTQPGRTTGSSSSSPSPPASESVSGSTSDPAP